ncbi:GST N-terminal domain-containing protein [Mycena chlorophos]|uniref:GST N-terminal domain-containing protein n=1 Tax=Mycena chlorophos TaxID=658473 RepID=A0A8H6TN00_MYCCL|nr:GST N-terminal domain-containing protein [Mycena chlorophos]
MSGIVFYDLDSQRTGVCWSPNTLKTRYALNFKRLNYTTKWIEYPDIENLCKEIGCPPSRNKPDGRPHYTLPLIHDLDTGAVITDSFKIAVYLDKTYPAPAHPALTGMPPEANGFALIGAFEEAMQPIVATLYPFTIPSSQAILNPPSGEYFRATREVTFGMTLEELFPTPGSEREATLWKKVYDGFTTVDGWLRAGVDGDKAQFFGGKQPNYADLFVASYLVWIKTVLKEDKWEDVKGWHGGRWARFLDAMKEYE